MRDIADYSFEDWRHLRPLSQAYKTALYRAATAWHVRRAAPDLAGVLEAARTAGRPALAMSVAFEAPWSIARQIGLARRFLTDAYFLVADNSRDATASAEIAAICASAHVPYLRLPRDPSKKGSRSHAMALNWLYRNLACPLAPAAFAFLDHDIFPTHEVRLADLVARQPAYGVIKVVETRWFLWAGYCVYSGKLAAHGKLDFSQDWFKGMDTGGANFSRLYSGLDRGVMDFARHERAERRDPATGTAIPVEIIDGWLHLCNVSGWDTANRIAPELLDRVVVAEVGA